MARPIPFLFPKLQRKEKPWDLKKVISGQNLTLINLRHRSGLLIPLIKHHTHALNMLTQFGVIKRGE